MLPKEVRRGSAPVPVLATCWIAVDLLRLVCDDLLILKPVLSLCLCCGLVVRLMMRSLTSWMRPCS
jgi:hypothetical protein